MKLNSKETKHRTEIIYSIMGKLKDYKNELEKLKGIEFLIKDSYLNIDGDRSVLGLFNKQSMVKKMVLMEIEQDSGAKPGQLDYLPEKEEEIKIEKPDFNQGPPLIDEEIFDGFSDGKGNQEEGLKADEIPEGIDVKEHDQEETERIVEEFKKKVGKGSQKERKENIDVLKAREKYKQEMKGLGMELFGKIERQKLILEKKNEMYAQAIADLESAIVQLHRKHGKQMVEIYLEQRQLQNEIEGKMVNVMEFDEKIEMCKEVKNKEESCEENRKLQGVYIENLQQQITLNEGILKELQKLKNYPDKNIEEGEESQLPVVQEEGEEIKKEIQEGKEEIKQLENIEEEIAKELEQIKPETKEKDQKKAKEEKEDKKEKKEKEKKEKEKKEKEKKEKEKKVEKKGQKEKKENKVEKKKKKAGIEEEVKKEKKKEEKLEKKAEKIKKESFLNLKKARQ